MLHLDPGRRRLLIAAITLPAAATVRASSGEPPTLRLVNPYPAGGSVDVWVRALQQELEGRHGFVVQPAYVPGASGVVALNQVHQTADDGTVSLLVGGTAMFSQMPLLPDSALKFNPNDVFVPLAVLWEEPFFVATRADAPWRSFEELVSRASAPQARLSYGTTGVQTTGGLYFDHFARRRNLGLVQVPFKGMAEVITNLLGGHVDVGVVSYQQVKPHLDSRALRLLASTGAQRSALAPDVPTMLELEQADFGCTVWFGLFARKSTDPVQLARVQAALKAVLDDPALRTRLGGMGYGVLGLTGADAARYVQQSNQVWQRILGRRPGS